MSDIRVRCVDQTLTITNAPVIASGGVGEDRVVFDFCPLWDGYVKTAMFFTNQNEGYSVLIENNVAVIPSQVMASEGFATFGVIGVNGSVTRTSEVLRYNIVRGANTVITPAPSLDIYTQILNAISGTVIPEEVREQHYRSSIRFWTGTQAEYNALTPANGTMYFITDADPCETLEGRVDDLEDATTALGTTQSTMSTKLNNIVDWVKTKTTEDGWKVTQWNSGKMEAVKTFTQSIELTSYAPLYRSDLITIDYPIGIFDTVTNAPTITINDPNNFVGGVLYGNNDVKFRVYGAVATTNNTKITVRVIGI